MLVCRYFVDLDCIYWGCHVSSCKNKAAQKLLKVCIVDQAGRLLTK